MVSCLTSIIGGIFLTSQDSTKEKKTCRNSSIPLGDRIVTRTISLPNIWVVTSNSPLFTWGRSGGPKAYSGWSYAQENFQTGWSRVTSSTGGDSLNEGIFHSQSTQFTIETVQYDVWGWNKKTHAYDIHVGHCPPDSVIGVNWTVFGRVDTPFNGVERRIDNEAFSFNLSIDPSFQNLNVKMSGDNVPQTHFELFDILGRKIGEKAQVEYPAFDYSIASLPSGTYICRMNRNNASLSKLFRILR